MRRSPPISLAGERYWLLTLHPKCPPELFERYRALAGAHARFIEPEQVMAAQRAADVLVSDTSSIVSEFIVQHKPVVTFRNRVPKPHMIDFDDPRSCRRCCSARCIRTPRCRRRSCATPTPSTRTAMACPASG
jgi:CDP-glycerol glycerophosphotransferase (TagB/SpsB family)